uniref:PAP-associated domain-containing protein n=1 Tax=Ditylenchus dipsaci TaxID=166011 RepID=A0A915E549_9BILA
MHQSERIKQQQFNVLSHLQNMLERTVIKAETVMLGDVDERVAPLVLIVKAWAKKHKINSARDNTLSSYSLVLMVIHYLQSGVQPPVLPFLQQEYPELFNKYLDVNELDYTRGSVFSKQRFQNNNGQHHLSELLIGFFNYYAYKFNFKTDKVSITGTSMQDTAPMPAGSPENDSSSQNLMVCFRMTVDTASQVTSNKPVRDENPVVTPENVESNEENDDFDRTELEKVLL